MFCNVLRYDKNIFAMFTRIKQYYIKRKDLYECKMMEYPVNYILYGNVFRKTFFSSTKQL